jgi:hypothetical protein
VRDADANVGGAGENSEFSPHELWDELRFCGDGPVRAFVVLASEALYNPGALWRRK